MTRIRYTMPARLVEKDIRRWLTTRLDGFYCGMHITCRPRVIGLGLARTRIVLNNARGLTPRDAVKALIKATGLGPHLSVCGWLFCLGDVGGVDNMEGGGVA